jgi:flagellar biosynthesis GTPase FlhF
MKNKQTEFQEQYDLLSDKIARLRKAHAIETDPSVRFKLEKEIEEIEQERDHVEQELESLVSSKTICLSSVDYTVYLERLKSYVLESFRQDHYVMLTVESLDTEDADTLTAVQEALRSAFKIHVEPELKGEGKREPLEKAIGNHRLVALLGDPGIGKTMSLRFITLQHIQQVLENTTQVIPIWVSLGK